MAAFHKIKKDIAIVDPFAYYFGGGNVSGNWPVLEAGSAVLCGTEIIFQ